MTIKNVSLFLFLALLLTAFTVNQAQDGKEKKETKKECSTQEKKSCGAGETTCGSSCGDKEVMPKETTTKQAAIFNTVCPVKGESVNTKASTYTYNGKVYGFCCNGCDETFKKDPSKYSKNLSADGKTFVGKK
ncbi:MAG: YHS domain-containing protein [bacterium]